MSTIRATYEQGALKLAEQIELEEGAEVDVIVIARQPNNGEKLLQDQEWNALTELLNECAVDTGIPDLAHQHDHYLYGTPKKD